MIKTIELQIYEDSFVCEVEFDFTAGTKGRFYGLPENCYPAEPDEYDITSLILRDGKMFYNANFLISAMGEDIEDAIRALPADEPEEPE
jgi:hypothetical protein